MQFGGLLVAVFTTPQLQFYASSGAVQESSLSEALFYLAYIIVAATLIIIVLRFYRGRILFVLIEAFIVLLATGFVLFAVFSTALPDVNQYLVIAASAAIATALIVAKNFKPRMRNLLAVTSSMGVGILIGLNGFYLAYLLMMLIAVYDYIAVFITKHMLTMAREISSRNLAFLIGSTDVTAMPASYMASKDVKEFKKISKGQKAGDPMLRRLAGQGIIPLVSQVQLGSGDLALPLMVAVSAYMSFLSYFAAVMVSIGAACGMVFTMYLLKRYKVALPAIPPLFSFISLSLAVLFAVEDVSDFRVWLAFLAVSAVTMALLMRKLRSADTASS